MYKMSASLCSLYLLPLLAASLATPLNIHPCFFTYRKIVVLFFSAFSNIALLGEHFVGLRTHSYL